MERKIACIGLGRHMRKTLYPEISRSGFCLAAVCDQEETQMEEFRKFVPLERSHCYREFEEMLDRERPDAVLCAVNPKVHYKVAKACLERGISPFIEKTPCENVEQAEELKRLEQDSGCFCMVGFNRRFATSYRMMKELLRTEFPEPLLYMAKYNSSHYLSEQSFLLNHMIHHLDLIRFLLGEITEIRAEEKILGEGLIGVHIRFQTENGTLGFLQSSSFQEEAFPMERVEIQGLGRNLVVDNVKKLEYNRGAQNKTEVNPRLDKTEDTLCWNWNQGHSSMYSHYGYEREMDIYFNALKTGKKPECCMDEAVETMRLYEMLLEHTVRI